MSFDNIKELTRQYMSSNKELLGKKKFEYLVVTVEKELLNDDINEYNNKKINAEKEIKSLYTKIDDISSNFKAEYEKIKKGYINDLDEQVAFITNEKINYQTIVSGSASLFENMKHFQDMLKDNVKKINTFSSRLNHLQSSLQSDGNKAVNDCKKQSKKYFQEEQKKIFNELREYYNQKK
jgi:hypothetical protein